MPSHGGRNLLRPPRCHGRLRRPEKATTTAGGTSCPLSFQTPASFAAERVTSASPKASATTAAASVSLDAFLPPNPQPLWQRKSRRVIIAYHHLQMAMRADDAAAVFALTSRVNTYSTPRYIRWHSYRNMRRRPAGDPHGIRLAAATPARYY